MSNEDCLFDFAPLTLGVSALYLRWLAMCLSFTLRLAGKRQRGLPRVEALANYSSPRSTQPS